MSNEKKCYACDSLASGQTDHNGTRQAACSRHSDPKLPKLSACIYCGDATRKGSLFVNLYGPQTYAHHKCHAEAVRS